MLFTTSYIAVPNVPVPVSPAPPGPYWSIDIGLVDPATGIYYLADKTNCGVDVFDAKTNTYLQTIGPAGGKPSFATVTSSCASIGSPFKGNTGSSSASGPNGLVLIGSTKMYAGDGDGTVKVIDLTTRTVTGTIVIPTAKKRTDEGAYDPDDKVVLIANDSETSPLLTYIDATTDKVIAQTVRTDATAGMESSLYIPQLKKFIQAVPATKTNKNGEIDVIDPVSHVVTAVYAMPGPCGPTGTALGPNNKLVVACGDLGETYVIDVTNGSTVAVITDAGGGDETAYDATTNRFYVTNSNNTSTGAKTGAAQPVTTVIDAGSARFMQNIPSEAHAHSVATYNGKAFVPLPSHGVAVYQ
ncbi:MAG TPA: hypothetical protein VHS78_10470 [Candidatus Elarobacter sp.]|nr:hypothetical protein [Candidatus Elarobacter sp.]